MLKLSCWPTSWSGTAAGGQRREGSSVSVVLAGVHGAQVAEVLSSPVSRARETAVTAADLQALAGYPRPPVTPLDGLNNRDWGPLEGKAAAEVRCHTTLPGAPCLSPACTSACLLASAACASLHASCMPVRSSLQPHTAHACSAATSTVPLEGFVHLLGTSGY